MGAHEPTVSVVIPTRDRWDLLAVTLATVLAQEGVDLEVVLVDDGSSAPIPSTGAPWDDARLRAVRHPRSEGVAAARNAGIRAARGRWIAFLDDDDVWTPDKLRAQLTAAEAVEASFVYSAAVLMHEHSGRLTSEPAPDPADLTVALRSYNAIPAGASNIMVQAELLERVGQFDPAFAHLAGWDMWIRLASAGPGASCSAPQVGYRIHAQSMRSSLAGVRRELVQLDRKHHGGRVAGADRYEVYLWLARGQLLVKRRGAALWTLVSGAARCRRPAALRRGWRVVSPRRHASATAAAPDDRSVAAFAPYLAGGARDASNSTRRQDAVPKQILRGPAACALRLVLQATRLQAGVALVYHEVAEGARRSPECDVVPVVPRELFEAQLRHLTTRYRVVPAHGLHAAVTTRRRGQRFPVALTFDDDLRGHSNVSAPALRLAGATATFFLTGASLREPTSFWWERLQRAIDNGMPPRSGEPQATAAMVESLPASERERWSDELLASLGGELPGWGLQADDLRALVSQGHEIGFHTKDHDVMTRLDDAELAAAMRRGRVDLEAATGHALRTIAYPHGKADARVASAARDAGYVAGFTTKPTAVLPRTCPLLMGRLYPSPDSLDRLALQLARSLLEARGNRD